MVRPLLMVFAFGLPMPIFIAGILWAFGDFIGIFVPSNIGNIAHLVGMGVGLLFGLVLRSWRKNLRRNIRIDENKMRNWENFYLRRKEH